MSKILYPCDVLIIGTSPLAICEATYHKRKGKKVICIDQRESVGGAWTTVKHENIPAVEIGCHIWDVDKWSTTFLKDFYGYNLVQLSPQPKILMSGKWWPYDWKINLISLKIIFKNVIRFNFKQLRKVIDSRGLKFSLVKRKYLYPKGGGNEICEQVEKKIKEEQIEVKLGSFVEKLTKTDEGVRVAISGEDSIVTQQVIITNLSNIQSIEFGENDVFKPVARQVDYIHLHLRLKGQKGKPFSYERWMKDPLIHRISDMTNQVAEQLEEDEQIICIGIHSSSYQNAESDTILNQAMDTLKKHGMVLPNTELVAHGFNIFPSYYNPESLLDSVEKRSRGSISFIRSANFTYSFGIQKDRYQSLI
jgi:protoporphyrinogen oxidase